MAEDSRVNSTQNIPLEMDQKKTVGTEMKGWDWSGHLLAPKNDVGVAKEPVHNRYPDFPSSRRPHTSSIASASPAALLTGAVRSPPTNISQVNNSLSTHNLGSQKGRRG